jgi:hypothetical protein
MDISKKIYSLQFTSMYQNYLAQTSGRVKYQEGINPTDPDIVCENCEVAYENLFNDLKKFIEEDDKS